MDGHQKPACQQRRHQRRKQTECLGNERSQFLDSPGPNQPLFQCSHGFRERQVRQDDGTNESHEQQHEAEVITRGMEIARLLRPCRLPDHERRENADQHGPGHGDIGQLPGIVEIALARRAQPFCKIECNSACHDHADAISRDIGRCHEGLHIALNGLDPVSIDDNILGCRGETEQHCGKRHVVETAGSRGVIHGHPDHGGHHHDLRQQEPAATLAHEAVQKWQWQLVHERRPDKLERIAECSPAEIGHGATIDTGLPEP